MNIIASAATSAAHRSEFEPTGPRAAHPDTARL
jgi:hypothetical protein